MQINAGEPKILNYLHGVATKKKFPVSCNFELTPRCNMNCKMCYIRKTEKEISSTGKRERTAQEWIDLGSQCRDAGTLFILLTGGEPFLRPDFKEIYIALHEMGFMLSINSNATMIDEKITKWLREYPPYRMNVTLYGSSNETYARLCNNTKGFDQVMNGIHLLKDIGLSIKLNASLTPYNIQDLREMYDIAKRENLYIQANTYMFPPIRKDESWFGYGDRFTAQKAAEYAVFVDQLRMDKESYKEYVRGIHEGICANRDRDEECLRDQVEPLWCRAGRSTCWINWDGIMTPCGLMNSPTAEPFEEGMLPAFRKITVETEKIRMPAKCTTCKNRFLCHVCGASVQAETGGFLNEPEYVCKMTEMVAEQAEMLYDQLYQNGDEINED